LSSSHSLNTTLDTHPPTFEFGIFFFPMQQVRPSSFIVYGIFLLFFRSSTFPMIFLSKRSGLLPSPSCTFLVFNFFTSLFFLLRSRGPPSPASILPPCLPRRLAMLSNFFFADACRTPHSSQRLSLNFGPLGVVHISSGYLKGQNFHFEGQPCFFFCAVGLPPFFQDSRLPEFPKFISSGVFHLSPLSIVFFC